MAYPYEEFGQDRREIEALQRKLEAEIARLQEAKRHALALANAKGKENCALRAALKQALRQWAMYADMHEQNEGFNLETEKSPEADMYRAALALLG